MDGFEKERWQEVTADPPPPPLETRKKGGGEIGGRGGTWEAPVTRVSPATSLGYGSDGKELIGARGGACESEGCSTGAGWRWLDVGSENGLGCESLYR